MYYWEIRKISKAIEQCAKWVNPGKVIWNVSFANFVERLRVIGSNRIAFFSERIFMMFVEVEPEDKKSIDYLREY